MSEDNPFRPPSPGDEPQTEPAGGEQPSQAEPGGGEQPSQAEPGGGEQPSQAEPGQPQPSEPGQPGAEPPLQVGHPPQVGPQVRAQPRPQVGAPPPQRRVPPRPGQPGLPPGFGPQPAAPPRSSWALILALAGIFGIGACLFFAVMASLPGATGGGGFGAPDAMGEKTLEGEGDAKFVLIKVEGVIMPGGQAGLFGPIGPDLVESVKKQLAKASEDEAVAGILLEIDSPGGTVTASDRIWKAVKDYKDATGKPVVVHMGAQCASGGYYIAAAGDELWAEPTTITGSIGVVLSAMNYSELFNEYGVKDVTITSGANKDLLNAQAPVREEHVEILQSMVDDAYETFVERVDEGRPELTLEEIKTLADGRIYTANQAEANGLIDGIGYREDAFAALLAKASANEGRLVVYTRPPTLADVLAGNVRSGAPQPGVTVNVDVDLDPAGLLQELRRPRLMALWRPF